MVSISIIKNNQLKSYFLLTFLITWFIFYLPVLFPINDGLVKVLLVAIGGTGPAFAALILSGILKPQKVDSERLKRWAVFLLVFIVTCFLIVSYLQIALTTSSMALLILIILNGAIPAYLISGGLSCNEGIRELLSKLYVWKVGLKWYLIALLLPPFIYLVSLLCGSYSTASPLTGIIPSISLSAVYGLIVSFGFIGLIRGPLREEIGWRGFALPRLQHLYSPLVATLILAVIWTIWHFPLYLNGIYPGGMEGFIGRFYWNVGITFLFTWIYNHSKGSLFLTTLFHTSVNTMGTVLLIPEAISAPFGLAFVAVINILAIVVIIGDKMWRKLPGGFEAVYEY